MLIGSSAMSTLAALTGIHAQQIIAGLTGPELLFVLCAGGVGWILALRRRASTEHTLPEEVGQTPLYAERCGAGNGPAGKGSATFQRIALYDQGMVLAQDRPPVFLRYSELEEAWRTHLGPWSSVQIRVTEDAWRTYYSSFTRALMISPKNVFIFASRDPDEILRILRDKGVNLRA